MPTLLNTNLFMHREVRTDGFNNLVCIAHPVTVPGIYYGDVYVQRTFLGQFRLRCEADCENRQVNINLSHFDPLFRHLHASLKEGMPEYTLTPGYPLVLHATEHHRGLYVVLEKAREHQDSKYVDRSADPGPAASTPVFDSRKLMTGDYVMLRPVATGDFLLRSHTGQQEVRIHVNTADEGRYYHPSKLEPVRLTLSADGFNEKTVSIQPFQLILVAIEVNDAWLELREQQL